MRPGVPYIIGSNHPNSFLDSVVGPTFMLRPWNFLARGDVFKGKMVKQILAWINMLPIFRKSDAKNNNEKNLITFDLVADLLNRKRVVMIFPEGYCVIEKRLRPISKGTARMAFHACEKYGFDMGLELIPTGLNYTKPFGIRGDMYYNFETPIPLKNYEEQYRKDPARAIVSLTEELETSMKKAVVHINHGLDEYAEMVFEIYANDREHRTFPIIDRSDSRPFREEKACADKLNLWQETDPERLDKFKSLVHSYKANLNAFKVNDALFSSTRSIKFKHLALLILLSPLWFYGYLSNFFIFRFAKHFPSKLLKSNVFYSSLRVGLLMIAYWIYFALILLILSLLFIFPIAIAYLLFHLIAGYSFALSYDYFQAIRKRKRPKALNNEVFEECVALRKAIKREIDRK